MAAERPAGMDEMAQPSAQQQSPAAVNYARALLELAGEQQQAEAVNAELQALSEAIGSDPAFGLFLKDPAISEDDRLGALKKATAGASTLLNNLLGVLSMHERLGLLSEVAAAYDDLLAEELGKIEVDVYVAQRLTGEQLEQVRHRVSAALKKEAVVHQYVDESIIGGLILRVQDQMIDASVRSQLSAIRSRLIASRPR